MSDRDQAGYSQVFERYLGLLYINARKKVIDADEARMWCRKLLERFGATGGNVDSEKGL